MEINWNTRITRDESRRHITQALHEKINLKGREQQPEQQAGKHAGPDAQRDLKRLGHMVTRGERPSRGDLYRLSHRLRTRIARAWRPWARVPVYGQDWLARKRDGCHPLVEPVQEGFALEHQVRVLRLERLRELLRAQGASPKRARTARIAEALACRRCRKVCQPGPDWPGPDGKQPCPCCGAILHRGFDTVEIAVCAQTEEPIGRITFPRR